MNSLSVEEKALSSRGDCDFRCSARRLLPQLISQFFLSLRRGGITSISCTSITGSRPGLTFSSGTSSVSASLSPPPQVCQGRHVLKAQLAFYLCPRQMLL